MFKIEEIRCDGNETGLKEGSGIEFETTVLHSRATLFALYLLTIHIQQFHPFDVFHQNQFVHLSTTRYDLSIALQDDIFSTTT